MKRPPEFIQGNGSRMIKSDEMTAHMMTVMASGLMKAGIGANQAEAISVDVVEEMRGHFGGQLIYIRKETSRECQEKAAEIYEKWQGGVSAIDLAQRYQHSIQWVYKLIALEREKRREQRNKI